MADVEIKDTGSNETVTLIARATAKDMAQIRELGRRYGTPYFIDIIRQAIHDALIHFNCPVDDLSKTSGH